ncbi:30S ribosomal protein S13 [Patescibacteria group bacterium]|nr:30S ribosomal protein S13 [Patescibacteria group bacterium]
MARIVGVDLPNERKVQFSLTVIYGIGPSLARRMVEDAKIPEEKRVKDLSEEEVSKLQKAIENFTVEGDLRRVVTQNIRRLEEIGSYRGIRHKRGLPVRGQRTRSNSRTKRGKRQTVGAIKKEMRSQIGEKAKSGS